jgi:hypothetical protein
MGQIRFQKRTTAETQTLAVRLKKKGLMNRWTKNIIFKIFGETILITIGVLFALYVDNWNQENENNKAEKEYIVRIIQDLKLDSIAWVLARVELTGNIENIDKILALKSKTELDKTSLVTLFNNVCRVETDYLHQDTYEMLKYNGGLTLIKDYHLLSQIVHYYSETSLLDFYNAEQIRTFDSYVNLLSETGFLVADELNVDQLYELFQVKGSRGSLNIRKTYADSFLQEINSKDDQTQKLIKELRTYKDK